ncbi:mitochondrial dicarboxylate carrier-like isoform X5 [Notamacropus eugenii]|uniref:mitochondrial dicarboxylate carrier-like isoform X5 n=1 Tax=Notamacropus eugenii TaxID=9315 RepID=UPI003B67FBB5
MLVLRFRSAATLKKRYVGPARMDSTYVFNPRQRQSLLNHQPKVHLQTQHKANIGFAGTVVRVISVSGFMALYSGLSASLCRQLTYSSTRFAIYHSLRDHVKHNQKQHLAFYQKVYMAALGGFIGGFLGSPAEMVNVRMQNDVKMPFHMRRNYSHVLNGITRVIKEEGFSTLFSGATLASGRGALMTVGQGLCATLLCQPMDVLKTRMMNAQDYDGIIHCVLKTAQLGPLAFYKGTFPAAIRLVPHTILTFVFLEQLRLNFGIPVRSDLGQD